MQTIKSFKVFTRESENKNWEIKKKTARKKRTSERASDSARVRTSIMCITKTKTYIKKNKYELYMMSHTQEVNRRFEQQWKRMGRRTV